MRVITLKEHCVEWNNHFLIEVEIIKAILSDNFIASYHIGSTAIFGIRAKPIIDIIVEIKSISEVDKCSLRFKDRNYDVKGEYGIKSRRYFEKGKNTKTHHIHMFESGNLEIERHRLFVEFMNTHPDRAKEYEKLKIELSNKYSDEPHKYSQGKLMFINAIDAEAYKWKNS